MLVIRKVRGGRIKNNCKGKGPIDTPPRLASPTPSRTNTSTHTNTQNHKHHNTKENGTPKVEARPLASRATRTPY